MINNNFMKKGEEIVKKQDLTGSWINEIIKGNMDSLKMNQLRSDYTQNYVIPDLIYIHSIWEENQGIINMMSEMGFDVNKHLSHIMIVDTMINDDIKSLSRIINHGYEITESRFMNILEYIDETGVDVGIESLDYFYNQMTLQNREMKIYKIKDKMKLNINKTK